MNALVAVLFRFGDVVLVSLPKMRPEAMKNLNDFIAIFFCRNEDSKTMNVEDFVVASTVNLVIAQRLIAVFCRV